MASSDETKDEKKELSGLARSIDALFPTEPPRPSGEEIVWEEVAEAPRARAADADPEALRAAVTDFLESGPLERKGKARAIREAAAALREAKALDVLADSVERLSQGAGDPPDEAYIAMAQALVTPGVASRIVARLGAAREEERRRELVLLCQRLGHDMALAISDALSDTSDRFARRTYLDTMVSMGPEALIIAEQMVEDSRWFVVRNAVAILGEIGGERSVELIVSTLAHADARIRREALLALAKVGGVDAGLLVYGMIDDPDPDVRRAAAMAAGTLKVERALKPLLLLLDAEEDPDVVVGVLRALGQLGDPGAVNAIEKRAVGSFFSRQPADVRIAAYRALHNIGTPHAKSLLVQAADDKAPEVKAAVRQLLGMR
jgi:HEAT repeat protein